MKRVRATGKHRLVIVALWLALLATLKGEAAAGISEADYNAVLDGIEQVYAPVIRARGARLQIDRGWREAVLQTHSRRDGSTWSIRIYGAIARHPAMTKDGFALVACHEIGHHLGGYPLWERGLTNEGGADYFATLKCFRRVLVPGDEAVTDPAASAACAAAHRDEAGRKLCRRSAMAGLSAARAHGAIQGEAGSPSFATPDRSVVQWMFPGHPSAQCRLDTYLQGALCARPREEDMSQTDPTAGGCTAKAGYRVGLRPRCWYKPPDDEPDPELGGGRRLDAKSIRRRLRAAQGALSGRGL